MATEKEKSGSELTVLESNLTKLEHGSCMESNSPAISILNPAEDLLDLLAIL
jgi:hypothetical protein